VNRLKRGRGDFTAGGRNHTRRYVRIARFTSESTCNFLGKQWVRCQLPRDGDGIAEE
jgi:hypothetical protein